MRLRPTSRPAFRTLESTTFLSIDMDEDQKKPFLVSGPRKHHWQIPCSVRQQPTVGGGEEWQLAVSGTYLSDEYVEILSLD